MPKKKTPAGTVKIIPKGKELAMAETPPEQKLEANMRAVLMPLDQLEKWDKNPRNIKEADFKKLQASLVKNPGFMQKRPLLVNHTKGKFVVYAGNMRLSAMKAMGWKEAPCIIEKDIPKARMHEEALKDNIEYGQWDMDLLSENFSEAELKEMQLPDREM